MNQPSSNPFFTSGDIIHSYSRSQAIADGELVDVSELATEAGMKFPVALTRAAWEDCVAWTDEDNRRHKTIQDETGRLWDVLYMTRFAAQMSTEGSREIKVLLHRVPRQGRGHMPRAVQLKATIGPGDDPRPVITIMCPGED